MVDNTMQTIAVLLLETLLRGRHFPEDRQEIVPLLKELIRWLRATGVSNDVARRAYLIAFDLLKKMIATTNLDIFDPLQEDGRLHVKESAQGALQHRH